MPTATSASTNVTAQMTLTLGAPLVKLIEEEGLRMGMKRSAFLRGVLMWHLGRGGVQRAPDAPPIKLPSPKGKDPKLLRIQLNMQEELLQHLNAVTKQAGNISRSSVIALIFLRWCGVDLIAPLVSP